jgi:hypothetical protein
LRAVVQAGMNTAAAVGACAGPLMIGALTKANPHAGWRNFYVCLYSSEYICSIGTDSYFSGSKWLSGA